MVGLPRWPRMVTAGLPGIRWTMKNVMIVTPTAVGTSSTSRRRTKLIRPMKTSLGVVGSVGRAGRDVRRPARPTVGSRGGSGQLEPELSQTSSMW